MRIIKYFFILFFFLSKVLIGYSQETEASIDIIHFNSSATYAPGSGVSVHIDPKGVYKLSDLNSDGVISSFEIESPNNNSFILELTDTNGNVIQQLSEVYDFYTPLINGDLPLNLSPGDYQLRSGLRMPKCLPSFMMKAVISNLLKNKKIRKKFHS